MPMDESSEEIPDTDVVVSEDLATLRSYELDALSAIIPPDRRDRMAEILSDDDVATLKHLAKEGTGANTLRAIASDLNYLESWSQAATGSPLPWPAPEALALKFLAHHLYDPVERDSNAAHGMPAEMIIALKGRGLPADGWTARRPRRSGAGSPFGRPCIDGAASRVHSDPRAWRNATRLAVRAAGRPRQRKSARPVTRDVLDLLLQTCKSGSLADVRDEALLLLAFASGGRRRSEVARVRYEDIVDRDPVAASSEDGVPLPCIALRLGRTKTAGAEQDERVVLIGRPVTALKVWIALSGIRKGALFRAIDRFGRVGETAMDPQSVNAILKKRCGLAGLSIEAFSAHGLRSGYLTEAARQGVPIQEAMKQSRHRSVQQASDYYNEVEIERGMAGRLGG